MPADTGGPAVPVSRFLQSPFWISFKAAHGWKARSYTVECTPNSEYHAMSGYQISILYREIIRGNFIVYIPLAPEWDPQTAQSRANLLVILAQSITALLKLPLICIRFDPPWTEGNQIAAKDSFCKMPLYRATSDVQPPDTVVLDLDRSSEDILCDMKPKWRYNIKLAEKKGIHVSCIRPGGDTAELSDSLDIFWKLYRETAARDGIATHAKQYYQDLFFHTPDRATCLSLYIAWHDNEPIAAIITVFYGQEAIYLYGASSNSKRNLMPAYLLQWTAIQDAKFAGCMQYDFYGIPPCDDPDHPMHGLYRFKTGFGGQIVHRIGSIDVPGNRLLYGIYRRVETIRAWWFKKAVKFLRKEKRRSS